VWVTVLLAEGDHRRARVAPWGKAPHGPRSRCRGSKGKPRARPDERWATGRDSLGVAECWGELARARQQSVLRVEDVPAREGHVETTTAAASVTPAGLGPLGHRQAHRPARPQGTGARAVRDPLGWPGTPTVVAGQTADAPRELPEMAQVRQSAPCTGLTSVGDGPRAALGTRAKSVAVWLK
jgi:hypothetical protein